ncbi:MAG: exodeoxyribonuclease VII small subunit [Candidatus Aminicenantes bacterium RBG_13_63_10]|nr:MAG: exodeoxyribonuclease VII small subunit [Candidatus Aminicenantes bacterium RBG_13_63_10]
MAKTTKSDQPGFEKALAELDQIVAKLEKGGLALNESLALFEKGVKLARFLREELDRAERKVEILLKDDKGGTKRVPFKLDSEDDEDEGGDEEGGEESGSPDKEGGELPF